MSPFKLSLQLAHHKHDEFDGSSALAADVMRSFDNFDWKGELERGEQFQRVSPTISVEDSDGRLIWVSAAGIGYGFEFISEYTYHGIVKRFFGLWKSEGNVTVETQTFTTTQARLALEHFVEGRHDDLLKLYRES